MKSRLGTALTRAFLPLAAIALLLLWTGLPDTRAALQSPAWYDSNAVGTAPDWHYRVPITIPANTEQYSTISIDVNFNSLLTSLGITTPYTFDNNSPRVTLADGVTLVTYQEFTDAYWSTLVGQDPLNDGRGNVRFIYPEAKVGSTRTYYLYFDITQNGTKTAYPTPINGNLEYSAPGAAPQLPAGWGAASRAGANWDAQVSAAGSVSVTTNVAAGGSNAAVPSATVTTDGNPYSGRYSYLLGARTANEPSTTVAAVTLDYIIKNVPTTCSGAIPNLRLKYRVEGWDGSVNSASPTARDWLRIQLIGSTTTEVVGPQKGSYTTLPFSPNLRTTAATSTQSGYRQYNGFDTDSSASHAHRSGMASPTFDFGQQPWITVNQSLAGYAGQANVTLRITSSHTTLYKSWFHIDDVEWCVVTTATLGPPQGFGVTITAAGGQPLSVTAQVDADATGGVTAYVYDGSNTLKTPSGVALTKSGATWSNASTYIFNADPTIDVPGTWTVRVFADDLSTSSFAGFGSSYNGLVWDGSGGSPPAQTSANFYNIAEQTFTYSGPVGTYNAYDTTNPGWPGTPPLTGYVQTKVSGSPFSLAVIALNAAKTAVNTGNNSTVTVELVDGSTGGAWDGTTGCRATWKTNTAITTSPATITVPLASGKSTTPNITVANAYRDVRVRLKVGGTVFGCSTDNFAIRPATITVSASDATWTAVGITRALNNTSATGGTVHAAGQPFTLTVSPQPVTATNYDTTSFTITSGYPTCNLPASCGTPGTKLSLGTFSATGSFGEQRSNTAAYTEVGAINLQLEDQSFAAVDAADTSGSCTSPPTPNRYVCATASAAIGRFVPDHFGVAKNTPKFNTFCGGASGFTYVGQPFWYATAPIVTLTAMNASGGTTANYGDANLFHLTTGMISQTYSNNSVGPALDTSAIGTLTLVNNGNGTATIGLNTGTITYTRNTTTPDSPLLNANISLSITASDTSELAANTGATIATSPTPVLFDGGGTGILFDAPVFYYGRLQLQNAHGSQTLDLSMPLQVQYWDGTAWQTNTLDGCTSLPAGSFALGNYYQLTTSNMPASNLPATNTTFSSGSASLTLKHPTGNPPAEGRVDVTINLGDTTSPNTCSAFTTPQPANPPGAGLSYLRGQWCAGGYVWDSVARATFGIYRSKFIFYREVY